ncbi:MAG: hypothetical protein K2Y32_05905 [Candidatus Obscuribacterales bacterium]|nr:hypothetical protein [Candidatus Obscuribacterales bacterium]
MYHEYSTADWVFVSLFSLIAFALGLLFGMLVTAAYEGGKRSVIGAYITVVTFFSAVLISIAWGLWDDGPFLLMPLGALLGVLITATVCLVSAGKEVQEELALAGEISADADRLFALLDNDKDGVISRRDIDAAGPLAERQGVSLRIVRHMRGSMSSIGHEVESGVYVASLIDLSSLEARRRDRFKAWL